MLISKKDLLAVTGISYGQLYRWKREGLIPEEWFVKQSSFTGQETFFPREQMLSRVQTIIELKDKYSLEEMERMFNPKVSERTYARFDIEKIEEIPGEDLDAFISAFGKNDFTFAEVVFLVLVSELKAQTGIERSTVEGLIEGAKPFFGSEGPQDVIFALYTYGDEHLLIAHPEQEWIFVDSRYDLVHESHFSEVTDRIRLKYQLG